MISNFQFIVILVTAALVAFNEYQFLKNPHSGVKDNNTLISIVLVATFFVTAGILTNLFRLTTALLK